jgi:GxxExxY protein
VRGRAAAAAGDPGAEGAAAGDGVGADGVVSNSRGKLRNTRKDAKMGSGIVLKEESYRIMGACFEVYKEKGNGFLEAVYQECLAAEFGMAGIPFAEKPRLQIYYKGRQLKQGYEPDFVCFDAIILEIKAVKQIADEHRAQVINYLKATGKEVGLLVNFGHHPKLQSERFVNQLRK